MHIPSPQHDLDALAAAIERRFPDLRPARPLRHIGSGFRSLALETPAGVVLRIGRLPDAADDYAREWRIGRFLAGRLGPIVPMPRWYAEPCAEFPHGALGYRKLRGDTPAAGVDPGPAFARDLGGFMARLHTIAIDDARAAGIPEVDAYDRMLGARAVVMPVLAARLEPAALARIGTWWAAFAADDRMRTARDAVCHHDLWHDNLLRSAQGQLSGVLDIAHVEISDPAHDFAAPRSFDTPFVNLLIAAYADAGGRLDAADAHRAQRFYEAREFGGLAWAIEHDAPPEVDDSIEKIKRGPILAEP